MATGKVKFFKDKKNDPNSTGATGFGFIVEHGTGNEIFVHISGVIGTIRKDDEVEYDVQEGKKGPEAVNVKRLVNA